MPSPNSVASQGPGGFLNLLGGPTDPYYALADGSSYATLADACAAVPAAARRNRTVSVGGVEYVWLTADLSDNGLGLKVIPGGGGGTGSPAIYADFSFTATADGAQSFALPAGTLGIDGVPGWFQADTGLVDPLANWDFTDGNLVVYATTAVKAGDKFFGRRYYGGTPGAGGGSGSGYTDQQAIDANRQPIADAVANAPVSPDQQDAIDAAKADAIDQALTQAEQQLKVPIDTGIFIFNSTTRLFDQIDVDQLDPDLVAELLINSSSALAKLKAAIGSTGGGGGGTTPTVTRFSSIANNQNGQPITYFAAASPVPAYFQGTAGVGAESGANAGLLDLKLAANTDGYVEFQYYDTDGIYGHLGFNTSGGTAQARNLLKTGIYIEDGKIGTIDNGVLTLSSTAIPLGSRLRLGRVGSVYKVYVVSADRATVTDFLTLTYTGTDEMFSGLSISDNKKVYDALGGNLIPR